MRNRGFTLIEVLIAMTVFVVFVTSLLTAYFNIARAQREANERRIMYAEVRDIVDELTFYLRDYALNYGTDSKYEGTPEKISLLSKDGSEKLEIVYVNDNDSIRIGAAVINKHVDVSSFSATVRPMQNPYYFEAFDKPASQFQPSVTLKMTFEKELSSGEVISMPIQTTISSRVYAPVIYQDEKYIREGVIFDNLRGNDE